MHFPAEKDHSFTEDSCSLHTHQNRRPIHSLPTFMDQRNQRFLPSNAPALIECPNIPTSDLDSFESSLVFSPRYDSGRECKAIVGQSILEDDVSARLEAPLSVDSDFEHGSRAGVPSIFPKPPIHSAQADLQRRRHNIRRQRNRSLVKTIWHPWETYSPNYQKYREKQQLKKPGEQKVWPDNVEQAFQDGEWLLSLITAFPDTQNLSSTTVSQAWPGEGRA